MLILKAIVADDDFIIIVLLQHKRNSKKGRLPSNMSEPEWLEGPSHRTKVVANPVCNLASLSKLMQFDSRNTPVTC